MTTKNVECQLAQGQIGRYLGGDRFSPDAMKHLEAHITECDECMAMVTEKRHDLMERLGSVPTRAVVEIDTSKSGRERLTEEIAKKSGAMAKAKDSLLKAMLPKPVLYAGLLAIVLMGMSYMSRGALKRFGPTAGDTLPVAKAEATIPSSATVPPKSAPPRRNPPKLQQPTQKPKPVVRKTVAHRQAARVQPVHVTVRRRLIPRRTSWRRRLLPRHQRPRPTHANSIRIYDPQGRPIS